MDKNYKYFNYASVDFLIDREGKIFFLEVNDNTLAPYYIEMKNRVSNKYLSQNREIENLNHEHLALLLSCFNKHNYQDDKLITEKSIGVICRRRNHSKSIEKEIQFLLKVFRKDGYHASMYTPEEIGIKDNYLYSKKTNEYPSIIFRRNFNYPSFNIKQPVINDIRAREIAANKYYTHLLLKKINVDSKIKFKQPKTYLIKNKNDLFMRLNSFIDNKTECIAKPNSLYGGEGFFAFDKNTKLDKTSESQKIDQILNYINNGYDYIVQEKIIPSIFKSNNKKEYYFDLRVMIYGGKYAAIEGRRSNVPVNNKCNKCNLVTNIKRGGIDLIVMKSNNIEKNYEIENLTKGQFIKEMDFNIDSNVLVLNNKLFEDLKYLSEKIVGKIEKSISKGVTFEKKQ